MRLRIEPGNVITFSVGLLFIAGGFYVWTSMGRVIAVAQELRATVVNVVYEAGTKKARNHPVVRFTTRDGRELELTAQQHQSVQLGQTLTVLYDPARPNEVALDTLERVEHRRVLITVLAVAVGLLVCVLGVGLDANTLQWRFKRRG